MKNILFVDGVAPFKYDFEIVKEKGIGASEGYLLHLANELKPYYNITISQRKYEKGDERVNNGVYFIPLDKKVIENSGHYDIIIVQRQHFLIKELKELYPNAKIIVWLHDFFEGSCYSSMEKNELQDIFASALFVCVSKWQMNNYLTNLKLRKAEVKEENFTYNNFFIPIPKIENKMPYDKNKLVYFSAGHKGFDFSFFAFKFLHEINPDFRFYVANPTYDQKYQFENCGLKDSPVVYLENLNREDVFNHLQSSLCALHLNNVYPETFGCINAEANSVGCPVLCYDLGATISAIDSPYKSGQFIQSNPYRYDKDNLMYITETIFKWRKYGKPKVKLPEHLETKKIIDKWKEIIG